MADKQSNKSLKAEKLGITIPLSKVKGQLDSNINKLTKEVIAPLKNQLDEMQYLPKEKATKSAEGSSEKPVKRVERPEWTTHSEKLKERDALRKQLSASKKVLPDEERKRIDDQIEALGELDKAVALHNKISKVSKDQVRFRAVAFSALACGLQYMLDALCQYAKSKAGTNKVTPVHLLAGRACDSPMYTYLGNLPAYRELVDFKAKHDEHSRAIEEFGARWANFDTNEAALVAKRDVERVAIDRCQVPNEFSFTSRSEHAARYAKYVAETLDALYPKDQPKETKADKLFCDFVATLLAQFVDRMCPYLKLCIRAAASKTVDAYMVTESLELMAQDQGTTAKSVSDYIMAKLATAKFDDKSVVTDAVPTPTEAPAESQPRQKKSGRRHAKAAAQ